VSPFVLFAFLAVQPADLLAQLRSDDPAVRLGAVQQVERLGAEEGADAVYLVPLAKLLADPDPQTRGLAALALSRHISACQGRAAEGLVGPLLHALGDDNRHLVAYCGRTLAILGDRALPEITTWLQAGRPRADRLAALQACRYLAANPNARPAVTALLWHVLADHDERIRDFAFALVKQLRADYALPPMRDRERVAAVLRVDDPRLRTYAALQLTALEADAFPLLADLLDDPDSPAWPEAVRAFDRLLVRGFEPPEELVTTLLRRIDRPELASLKPLHAVLASIARDQGSAPEAVVTRVDTFLGQLAEASLFGERPDVLQELAGIEADAIKVLRQRLIGIQPRRHAAAAESLRRLLLRPEHRPATPRTLTALALALHSADLDVARESALALAVALEPGYPVPRAVIAALRTVLPRDDSLLRVACARALAGCGNQATETILALLDHPEPAVQVHAIRAILDLLERHHVRLSAATERLQRLNDSPSPRVRELADRTLRALRSGLRPASPFADDTLRDLAALLIRTFGSREESIRVTRALLADGKPGAAFASALAKLLGDSTVPTRVLAAEALAEQIALHPDRFPVGVVLALVSGLEDGEPEVREPCRRTLEALGTKSVVAVVRSALSADQPREQRRAALRPLIVLTSLELGRRPLSPLYWELLFDSDPVVRERLSSFILLIFRTSRRDSFLESGEIPLDTLISALRMSEPATRELALRELVHRRGERGALASRLIPLLEDDNPFARTEADRLLVNLVWNLDRAERVRVRLLLSRLEATEAPQLRPALSGSPLDSVSFLRDQFAWEASRPTERVPTSDPTLQLAQLLASQPTPDDLLAALRSDQQTLHLSALWRIERLVNEGVLEPALVPVLARLLFDADPEARIQAARALEAHLPALHGNVPDLVMLALLLAQQDPQTAVVTSATRAYQAQRATPWTLNDLVAYRDPRIREAAAILQVGRMLKDRKAISRALTLLGAVLLGPDQESRRAAVVAVSLALRERVRLPSEVLLGLRLGIKSDDRNLRRASIETLAACGSQAEDSLGSLLESDTVEVQRSAAEAVLLMLQRTKYVPRQTVPQLRALLEVKDQELRQKVKEALAAIERASEGDKEP
jgi:hypothetical protein